MSSPVETIVTSTEARLGPQWVLQAVREKLLRGGHEITGPPDVLIEADGIHVTVPVRRVVRASRP